MNWNKALGTILVLAAIGGFFAMLFRHVVMSKLEVGLLGAFLALGVALFNQALADDLMDRVGKYLPFLKKSGP